jgi:hypothetical protein
METKDLLPCSQEPVPILSQVSPLNQLYGVESLLRS